TFGPLFSVRVALILRSAFSAGMLRRALYQAPRRAPCRAPCRAWWLALRMSQRWTALRKGRSRDGKTREKRWQPASDAGISIGSTSEYVAGRLCNDRSAQILVPNLPNLANRFPAGLRTRWA